MYNKQKKYCIREKKHLLTDADSSTNTEYNPASKEKVVENQKKIAQRFYTLYNPLKKVFAAAILDHFWAKMFKSETTSFQNFSPRIVNL